MSKPTETAATVEPPPPASDTLSTSTVGPAITTSRPKSLISNGLWSVLFTVWSTGVTFFLTPFLIARIGTDHYGLFILLMSISGMMGLMNLGLGEATLRYVAYYYGRNDMAGINRVVGATCSVYLVTGLLGWAALFFGAHWITGLLALSAADRELGASLLRLTAFSFGLSFISGAYASIPQALQRFDISTKVNIAQSAFQVAGTLFILFTGRGVYELVLWSVATAVFIQVLNTVVAKRLIPNLHLRPKPSKAGLKEVFGYGVFSLLSSILTMIWGQVDRLLLGAFVSSSSVAYLTVPQQLAFRLTAAVTGTGSGLMPRLSAMSDAVHRRQLFLNATWVMLCLTVVVFVPLTILMPDLLRLWIGAEFAERSAWVGQLIGLSCIVRGAFGPYQTIFSALGKPAYQTCQSLVSAVVSLAVNLSLIPVLGLSGAGYSYLATAVVGLTTVVLTWRYVLGDRRILPLFQAIVPPMAAAAIGISLCILLRGHMSSAGWVDFGVLAGISVLGTALILVLTELVLGSGLVRMRMVLMASRSVLFRRDRTNNGTQTRP